MPTQLSHDVNLTYSLKDGRYNVALECRNITNARLYDNFSLQKPGRAFYIKLRYFFYK
ncbi:MAG: TonB-dependent receptor [Taibaiella sp.]|nr:TonB-dependent receptor [Taibaiella sp.]